MAWTLDNIQNNTIEGSTVLGGGVMPVLGNGSGVSAGPPKEWSLFAPRPGGAGVSTPALSLLDNGIIQQSEKKPSRVTTVQDVERGNPCEDWRSVKGTCSEHGTVRWRYVRCKRRDCQGCSAVKQWGYARRIGAGIREIGVERCISIVLTYADEQAEDSNWKPTAVKLESSFIRWLRKRQKELGNPRFEYAKTWELQKSGRLHTNIIIGPWVSMDFEEVRARWLAEQRTINPDLKWARISMIWCRDDSGISREATKAQSPEGLGFYTTKIEQQVPKNWHRRISFSRGWPKLKEEPTPQRVGEIRWEKARDLVVGELLDFEVQRSKGWWLETSPGSCEYVDKLIPEPCDCYSYADLRATEWEPLFGDEPEPEKENAQDPGLLGVALADQLGLIEINCF